ncbi:hypothetical protein ACTMUQ_41525 [Streptomyces sp. SD11]|uniref:hypothetical protein n=1 Tax=Streptomyces sp. SD11 TaxID=3452209 RepID=UPI003F894B23
MRLVLSWDASRCAGPGGIRLVWHDDTGWAHNLLRPDAIGAIPCGPLTALQRVFATPHDVASVADALVSRRFHRYNGDHHGQWEQAAQVRAAIDAFHLIDYVCEEGRRLLSSQGGTFVPGRVMSPSLEGSWGFVGETIRVLFLLAAQVAAGSIRCSRPGDDRLMSFAGYAKRIRDRGLPHGRRYTALRCAAGQYCPLGFNATWSYLSTAGSLRHDEAALLRALDMLELSRNVWLTELEAFADRRRAEKRQNRRRPSAAELRYVHGWRWPGPEGHHAMFREIELLWAAHVEIPFPEVPHADKPDLVYLDSSIAGCISTYLGNGGSPGLGHRDILLNCLPEVDRQGAQLGYPTAFTQAFAYFRRLGKAAELVINDRP